MSLPVTDGLRVDIDPAEQSAGLDPLVDTGPEGLSVPLDGGSPTLDTDAQGHPHIASSGFAEWIAPSLSMRRWTQATQVILADLDADGSAFVYNGQAGTTPIGDGDLELQAFDTGSQAGHVDPDGGFSTPTVIGEAQPSVSVARVGGGEALAVANCGEDVDTVPDPTSVDWDHFEVSVDSGRVYRWLVYDRALTDSEIDDLRGWARDALGVDVSGCLVTVAPPLRLKQRDDDGALGRPVRLKQIGAAVQSDPVRLKQTHL